MYVAGEALHFIAFSWAIGYGKRADLAPCVTIRHPGQVPQSGARLEGRVWRKEVSYAGNK